MPLTIFAKHSILDIWQGSEYAFEGTRTTCMEIVLLVPSQPAFICSKLTKETPEQGVKYYSKLTIKTSERRCRSVVFIVNFEHVSLLVLVLLFLTLNM